MSEEYKSKKEILLDTQKNKTIYLKAGEIYHTQSQEIIHTVLGSCFAFVFHYHPLKLSAICHAQVAQKNSADKSCYKNCPVKCLTPVSELCEFKYVTCSFRYMLDLFRKNNIPTNKIEVKLFGGANVLPYSNKEQTIGEANIETALKLIKLHNLKVTSKSIGGTKGRVLYLYTESGEVYLSKIKNDNNYKLYT